MLRTRPFAIVVALALLAASVPLGAHAQQPDQLPQDSTVIVGDGTQDVLLTILPKVGGGQKQNASEKGAYFDHLDVTKIVFGEETDKDFKIGLHLRSLTAQGPIPNFPGQGSWRVVQFSYGLVNWLVRPGGCGGGGGGGGGGGSSVGCLQFQDPGVNFRTKGTVPMETRASENAYYFTIDKLMINDHNHVPARYGDSLKNISATTSQYYVRTDWISWLPTGDPSGGVYASDRAPNEGFGNAFTFVKGSASRGHVALSSLDPIRVSNGEATTIVYKVNLANHHSEPLSVELTAAGLPFKDWTVRVPALLKVEPHSSLTFPVILALPFFHEHGKTYTFKVEARALEDPNSFSAIDLGVFWTDVAQPSAHHNGYLFFHSTPAPDSQQNPFDGAFPTMLSWSNAEPVDPNPDATDGDVPASWNQCLFFFGGGGGGGCGVPPKFRADWWFPLSPKLLLGLDFDTSKTGRAKVSIIPKISSPQATMTVRVLYCDPTRPIGGGGGGGGGGGQQSSPTCGNSTWSYNQVLASMVATGSLGGNAMWTVEKELTIDPIADYIPFRHGANIGVHVRLETDTPQNAFGTEPRPFLVTKNAGEPPIILPLIEYHDPIDQAFENVGSLALVALTPFEKLVNPGRTSVFKFDLKSSSEEKQDVKVAVEGINAEWAEIVTDHLFTLGPKETRNITVAVRVPVDAGSEERAELFVTAQNVDDESTITVTRLRATVVLEPEIPDEEELASGLSSTQTPGVSAALLVGALLGLAWAHRHRRL